jgi:hypothetical protein
LFLPRERFSPLARSRGTDRLRVLPVLVVKPLCSRWQALQTHRSHRDATYWVPGNRKHCYLLRESRIIWRVSNEGPYPGASGFLSLRRLPLSIATGAPVRRGIRRGILEGLILDALKDNLMHPDLVAEFIKEFHAEVNRQRRDAELSLVLKRRELDDVRRKLDGLIEAIADGLRAPGLQSKLDELGERKTALEADITGAPTAAPRLHPNLAEIYRQKVANLQQALADPATQTEALEILRGLIEQASKWWCARPMTASPSSW